MKKRTDRHGCCSSARLNNYGCTWRLRKLSALWRHNKLCGPLSSHSKITLVSRFCTNMWSPRQVECMLSIKQKTFWNSWTFVFKDWAFGLFFNLLSRYYQMQTEVFWLDVSGFWNLLYVCKDSSNLKHQASVFQISVSVMTIFSFCDYMFTTNNEKENLECWYFISTYMKTYFHHIRGT